MPAAHLTAIEINGTYYGSQKAGKFRPAGMTRRRTASSFNPERPAASPPTGVCWARGGGRPSEKFLESGNHPPRGKKLGPPQLGNSWRRKKFDEADFTAFSLKTSLPKTHDGPESCVMRSKCVMKALSAGNSSISAGKAGRRHYRRDVTSEFPCIADVNRRFRLLPA